MDVTFWGVRGSLPCCGEEYLRTGGDSSCVSAIAGNKVVVFDAGTGIRRLGLWLDQYPHIKEVHLFLSHVHYDHVIGFPFFKPLWREDIKIFVYTTILEKHGGGETFFKDRVFADPFFPVTLDMLRCDLSFRDCHDGESIDIDPKTTVFIEKLNHPGGASGFRLVHEEKIVAYVSDTEHLEESPDNNVLKLIKDADLVVYDATFTDEEYPNFKGWGHSTWQEGMRLCQEKNVKKWRFTIMTRLTPTM